METKLRQDVVRIARREARLMLAPLVKRMRGYKKELAALKTTNRRSAADEASDAAQPKAMARRAPRITGEQAREWYTTANLVALREKLDLSASGMAALVGVRPWSIYRWEAGDKPSEGSMIKIASLRKISKARARQLLEQMQ